jgi:BASS family bile acid:Na+ symporter
MMIVVGIDLTFHDFRRVMKRTGLIVTATLGQSLIVVLAIAIAKGLSLDTQTAAALLLIAVCPTGGISNFFVYLARANTALSVTLTVFSCTAAVVTMPLLMWLSETYVSGFEGFAVPYRALAVNLLLLLGLPTALGMVTRRFKPTLADRLERPLRRLSLCGIIVALGLMVYTARKSVSIPLTEMSIAIALFVTLSMFLGYGLGWLARANRQDRFTLLIEYGVRNLGIALAVAVTILDWVEFAAFGAIYGPIDVLVCLGAVGVFGSRIGLRLGSRSASERSTGGRPRVRNKSPDTTR